MTEMVDSVLTVGPSEAHTHSLIFLHGGGSKAERIAYDESVPGKPGLLRARASSGLTLPERFPHFKFVFPTAPRRRCTARKRMGMRIWFDSASFEEPFIREELQLPGLQENARTIGELVRKEAELVGWSKVFLGGLSEGCAMAMHTLLSLDVDAEAPGLGGFIGMSGWLPFQPAFEAILSKVEEGEDQSSGIDESEITFGEDSETSSEGGDTANGATDEGAANRSKVACFIREEIMDQAACPSGALVCRDTPLFLGHGDADEVVPVQLGRRMMETVVAMGLNVSWTEYPGQGHWYKVPEEIDDLIRFIEANLERQPESWSTTP